MAENLIEIKHHTKFYHDRVSQITLLFGLLICLTALLGCFIAFQWISTPPPTYFGLTEQQQLFEEAPLSEPGMNTNAMLNWMTEAMMNIYSFNFMNADQVIKEVKEYFTEPGYAGYMQVLQETGEVDVVKNSRLILSGAASAAPIVEKEGVVRGFYMWQVKLPMILTYDSVDFKRTREIEVRAIVTRVSTQEAPVGLSIFKFETPVNNNVERQILQQAPRGLSPFGNR